MTRVCVIGGGPSGITAAKNLLAENVGEVVLYEQSDCLGGNWVFREDNTHSSVYETTHIISSKRLSAYEDYPMPDDWPDYPSHKLLLEYFQGYARHFGVERVTVFGARVISAVPDEAGKWHLQVSVQGQVLDEVFDYLCVCSGHHWDPMIPEVEGFFSGEILHSHAFKRAEPFRDKRVLIVGGGNSACDVAVETARVSAKTTISMRRGYYIIPKFIMGMPSDIVYARLGWVPRWLRRYLLKLTILLTQGRYESYGLQSPTCLPLEMHPTLNSELLYFIRHGEVHPKPGISHFEENWVHFTDGSYESFDAIIFATGYKTTFPFLSKDLYDFSESTALPLYRKMIPEKHETLFFIGLFQPQGCIWPLADLQARIAARQINGRWKRPADLKQRIEKEMASPHFNWEKATRHAGEVDYHIFRKELLAELG